MRSLFSQFSIKVNDKIYLKNPDESELGKRIIESSIILIDELGIEQFTFRKLGQRIGSPESTIYRYFENKHKLLVYLISWYWCWLEYRLVFSLANIESPTERLERAIDVLTGDIEQDDAFEHIDEVKLNRIVISESAKVYLTKAVDDENKLGLFGVYKNLVDRVVVIIRELHPEFQHPHSLISTVIEGAHQQKYFAQHLPSLTDITEDGGTVQDFFKQMVFCMIVRSKR